MNHDDFDSRKISGWSGWNLRKTAGALVYVISRCTQRKIPFESVKAYNAWLWSSISEHCGHTMPIYAYKCGACGFAKDQLQKISDPALTDCPQCGKPSFSKQLSAPGFQLKGSGWYATDFKSNNAPVATPATTDGGSAPVTDTPSKDAPASTAPVKTDTPTASASACAPSCACH